MDNSIHILCAADHKYSGKLGVMLTSLYENNISSDIIVHIFVDDVNQTCWNKFYKLSSKYNKKIELTPVPKQKLISFGAFESGYFSFAIYYRLLAAELLDASIEKIIYLDCDIIINGNIEGLWNISIQEHSMAVCPDFEYYNESNFARLHYCKRKWYFNSGVLLINLKYWRENHISTKCLQYLYDHKSEIVYMDQDVLNAVLIDTIKWIHVKFNFQVRFIRKEYFNHYDIRIQNEIRETFLSPIVIHYVGPNKPWHFKYRGMPYANIWLHYQLRSFCPFEFGLGPGSKKKMLKYFIKRMLWLFGIAKTTRHIDDEFAKLI